MLWKPSLFHQKLGNVLPKWEPGGGDFCVLILSGNCFLTYCTGEEVCSLLEGRRGWQAGALSVRMELVMIRNSLRLPCASPPPALLVSALFCESTLSDSQRLLPALPSVTLLAPPPSHWLTWGAVCPALCLAPPWAPHTPSHICVTVSLEVDRLPQPARHCAFLPWSAGLVWSSWRTEHVKSVCGTGWPHRTHPALPLQGLVVSQGLHLPRTEALLAPLGQ